MFSLLRLKLGVTGIFHAVSKEHLHCYLSEFDFRWNTRNMNDGERVCAAIKGASGKKLVYSMAEGQKSCAERSAANASHTINRTIL